VLHHFRWRKKKADFIIPPTYYRNSSYSITEVKPAVATTPPPSLVTPTPEVIPTASSEEAKPAPIEAPSSPVVTTREKPLSTQLPGQEGSPKVSALSLSSIRAKKELMEQQRNVVREEAKTLPTEKFTETELLEQWYKYADRLNDKGHKIMEALLRINDPKLEGTTVIHTLPNEGSKLDFEKEKPELVAFLRAKLHNHEIALEIEVNEEVKSKVAFTPQDKFNRLNEINPNLEVLKKMFDLDL
jgi:hypothetical protein